ncbi:hypothetical protein BDD14_5817 [Edaphobacter modestus]|uniref:Uncharacterized protein n=1 Tax=Edaphobacter modestus TaxID=388466 RepID=A0A4Q7YGE3_9BACT|nr:hypothetical protein BDD14_5817 [Edaphobacter modestus]
MCVVHDTLLWNAIATADAEEQICNAKSASRQSTVAVGTIIADRPPHRSPGCARLWFVLVKEYFYRLRNNDIGAALGIQVEDVFTRTGAVGAT